MIDKMFTSAEVIKILRLDCKSVKDTKESLRYLIRTGQIDPIKVCGNNLFTEQAIQAYIAYCQNQSEK